MANPALALANEENYTPVAPEPYISEDGWPQFQLWLDGIQRGEHLGPFTSWRKTETEAETCFNAYPPWLSHQLARDFVRLQELALSVAQLERAHNLNLGLPAPQSAKVGFEL